jgi:hypothetical protein
MEIKIERKGQPWWLILVIKKPLVTKNLKEKD